MHWGFSKKCQITKHKIPDTFKKMRAFNRARLRLISDLEQGKANLHEETLESLDDLIAINKLGFLTVDSQQGRIERGRVPNDRALHAKIWKQLNTRHWALTPDEPYEKVLENVDRKYRAKGGRYHHGTIAKEKAYLMGYIPESKADELINRLDQLDNVVAWKVKVSGQDGDCGTKTWVTYVPTTQDGAYSKDDRFPLTGVTHVNTFPMGFSESEYGELVGAREQDDSQFALVSIQDARFGHSATAPDGLFGRVINALK